MTSVHQLAPNLVLIRKIFYYDIMTSLECDYEISLPAGYEPVNVSFLTENPELLDRIRRFRHRTLYLFDPANLEYLVFLETCKIDTKLLAKELQSELDDRKISVWARGNRCPKSRHTHQRLNFLIRPPFLTSLISASEKRRIRMQPCDNVHNFILHVDVNHHLHTERHWNPPGQSVADEITYKKRQILGMRLTENLRNMEGIYGQWEIVARKIVDAIEPSPTDSRFWSFAG